MIKEKNYGNIFQVLKVQEFTKALKLEYCSNIKRNEWNSSN